MNTNRPLSVTITEVGMRDGFQFESKPIPTTLKLDVLSGLISAGIQRIQLTSFVHPKRVPQMADAEELCAHVSNYPDVSITALALNVRGVERALKAGIRCVDLSISTNDKHSRDNANMSRDEALEQALHMMELAHSHDMKIQMGFQCVFGYNAPGDTPIEVITSMIKRLDLGRLDSISLADSTGMANPVLIHHTLDAVRKASGDVPLVLHLHDTRGLGLANVFAALEKGITHFDTSLGGLGGCPFIPGATGNIATEDTVYMLESMSIDTGINRFKLAAVTSKVAQFLGRQLPGKLYRLTEAHASPS